ncbi:hypothetical protein [Bradyrhizobium sp. dw_78]|uniref:hypothetical protein n=1 Tax=Bradyrhizobium sp. dw_78 TaxID=2719793 RepID=UPI001BD65DBB|nr:hypothetical protein [Bradyrhizobium sp. dw_78]
MSFLSRLWRRSPEASRWRALRRLYAATPGRNTAESRGKHLLRYWLSPEQLGQFEAFGYFDVVGCNTSRRYRIHYGDAANIEELDQSGTPKFTWCFVPEGYLVAGDVVLAQKIALETDELRALAVANRFLPKSQQRHGSFRPF